MKIYFYKILFLSFIIVVIAYTTSNKKHESLEESAAGSVNIMMEGIVYDCSIFSIYVERGIVVPEEIITEITDAIEAYKVFVIDNYLPESCKLLKFRITFVNEANYPAFCSKTEDGIDNIVLNKDYISIFKETHNYWVLFHELTHALDRQYVHFPFTSMVEGYADVVASDFMDFYKPDWGGYGSFDLALNNEQWEDFLNYFISVSYDNSDPSAAYFVGYSFIRYLQEQYREDIMKVLIENCILEDNNWGIEPERFIEIIQESTSSDVFDNFREWYEGKSQTR